MYQRTHGLLAAQLAAHWKITARPPYWIQTLIAIAEHDDGLAETEAPENLTEAGAPRHFQLMEYDEIQYQNVMEIAVSKSRWNALLTSMHLDFLYQSKKAKSKKLALFLKEQQKFRRQLLAQLGVDPEEARQAYRFVEWCDALSLLLCMEQIPPEQRKMEISEAPDGTMHRLWQKPDQHLCIEPWPFEEKSFSVEAEYRIVTQLYFASIKELKKALWEADVSSAKWTFVCP